ncbi:MAG TPA: glucokinase [Myxococcota bacterium]|nr:glucokinase [Myxococcota bacterium]
MSLLLAGDIGGTNCRLALFADGRLLRRQIADTEGAGVLGPLRRFVGDDDISGACLAVAGPVVDGHATLTNHRWSFHADELAEALGCPARVVNDFHAAARGVRALGPDGWRSLNGVDPEPGVAVVLGPGTGLGQALLLADDSVVPGEGGHADFAPNSEEQLRLWRHLSERHGHVSLERVLSGQGLLDLHAFFRNEGLGGPVPSSPTEVSIGDDDAAIAARRCFVEVLGAQAGNLALQFLPAGGVWLCGGIPPRLDLQGVVEAFTHKGRFSERIERVPLCLVTDPRLGLLGAAALAAEVV